MGVHFPIKPNNQLFCTLYDSEISKYPISIKKKDIQNESESFHMPINKIICQFRLQPSH